MNTLKRKKLSGRAPKEKYKTNENRFDALRSIDEDDTYSEGEEEEEVREFKVVVPPIVVDAAYNFHSVYKLIGTSFEFKRMSIGTKIISPSLALFEQAKNKLKEAKYTFYTHECRDTKMFKLVLYGLPKTEINEIKDELKNAYNINVVNIKEITTSRSSMNDALYMLEFDRTINSKSQVLKIKRLCSIVVYWRKPMKGNKGPTQCTKCAMYGHGARNCFRKNICIACGGEHDLANCQINKTTQGSPAAYKCFNCIKKNLKNTGHKADDPRCPCRKEYLSIRQKLTNKTKMQNQRIYEVFEENPGDFPHFSRSESFVPFARGQPGRSYANTLQCHTQQNSNTGDLFSIDELFQIFTGALSDLRKCRSKMEQLNVIMTMLKYAI